MGKRKIKGIFRKEKPVLETSLFVTPALVLLYDTIIPTLIVVGILVFVHEFGHFILAKKLGVGVITFSLGFGPKLISKKIGETQYQIALIPLGGFVKLIGENPEEEVKQEDLHRAFSTQPIWKRFSIVAAGPFSNFILAMLFFSIINLFGIPSLLPKIGDISPGFPAEKAGLKKGDLVVSVNGENVKKWDELSKIIRSSEGKELFLKVKRGERILEIKVTPQSTLQKNLFGEEVKTFIIGITPSGDMIIEKAGPFKAIGMGVAQTWYGIKLTILTIVKLIERVVPAKTIGGPILIAQLAGEQAKKGLINLAFFMAILSVNLGIINLIPIPILDGGHFLFLAIEAILRRPISVRKMEIAQQIGLAIIIFLMIFAFYNDIIRIISP